MAAKLNLTKPVVAALEAPEAARQYLYDSKQPGLALCITPTGNKTWYVYRKIASRPERIRIGPWPAVTTEQARTEAARIVGAIADGKNPNDGRRVNRLAPKLGEVFDEYIESPSRGRSKRPRSPRTTEGYRWQFKAHLEPWRTRKLSQITRRDVEKLHNEIGDKHGRYIGNRVLALLKAVFNHAIEQGYFATNPATRLRPFEERSRERFLQEKELPAFWQALEATPAADFFKLCLLTGARQDNVRRMRWEQIDLDAALWRIPLTKSGQPLTLPLSREAVALLRTRRESITSEWVFPGRDTAGPIKVPRQAWKRVLAAAGIKDLRLHDLRRTLGSWQAMNGASLTVVGKSLGHSSLQATKIYARVDDATVRASIQTAADAMLAAAKTS